MAPRAKSVKPEDKPAPKDEAQITIDKAEFVRTRDALVTSWVTLQNALKNATSAYIDHSNAVLGGSVNLDPSQLDLSQFVQSGALVTVSGDGDAKGEKKQRKKATPRDPNEPKRPLTAYLLWLGENREKIHSDLGAEQKRGQISSEGTKRWNMLPESVKQKYKDAYQASREVYKKEMEEFKANGASAAAAAPAAESPEADEEEAETDEPAQAPAAAGAESDDDSDSSSEEEEKEPTPPPVKTPRSTKSSRKKAAPPASSPPVPASSPLKKGGAGFTTVNGATKRKSKADAETVAEEPKKKRGRKVKEEEAAPASAPVEPVSAKKDRGSKKKGRKSTGGEA